MIDRLDRDRFLKEEWTQFDFVIFPSQSEKEHNNPCAPSRISCQGLHDHEKTHEP